MKLPFNANDHPICNIQWIDVNELSANDYNPNFVLSPELRLLEYSLIKQGWIQPILVCVHGKTIIDGFHRYTLAKTRPKVFALTKGLVPCAMLDLTEAERMLLTVRINRAKGNHIALKMHELITAVHVEHGLSIEEIGREIGADKHEIETLLMTNIFEKKEVATHQYSKSWYPKGSNLIGDRAIKKGATA